MQALGSNDAGVSFLVHYGGKTIFHAGDLKRLELVCQKGQRRTMRAYRRRMREEFRKELEPLLGVHMDAAFVVMDMRLEERYKNGIDYFLHTMDADAVFPMHLWGRYDHDRNIKKN